MCIVPDHSAFDLSGLYGSFGISACITYLSADMAVRNIYVLIVTKERFC